MSTLLLLRFGLLPFTVSWWTNSVLQSALLTSNLDAWYAMRGRRPALPPRASKMR